MMNEYEFRVQLRDKLQAGVHTAIERRALADWVIANCARDPSTWEKIIKQYSELCCRSGRAYVIITTHTDSHALMRHVTGAWLTHIDYTDEEAFLRLLTAFAAFVKPAEVTRVEAVDALGVLEQEWEENSVAMLAKQVLQRYLDQLEVKEARP